MESSMGAGKAIRGGAMAGTAAVVAADTGAKAGLGAAKKVAAPVAVAAMGVDAARLAVNPQARKIAKKQAETTAKRSPLVRAGKAALDPINTIYGVGAQVGEAFSSSGNARRAKAAADAGQKRFDARKKARGWSKPPAH